MDFSLTKEQRDIKGRQRNLRERNFSLKWRRSMN